MNKGNINITLEGVSFEETERCRAIIHALFTAGVFSVRNGKAILNFDHLGLLAEVELQVKKWRRDKPQLPQSAMESAKIEIIAKDKVMV